MKRNIETYIRNTNIRNIPLSYDLALCELQDFNKMISSGSVFEAIHLAFLFGRAKGIRYARKEARRV